VGSACNSQSSQGCITERASTRRCSRQEDLPTRCRTGTASNLRTTESLARGRLVRPGRMRKHLLSNFQKTPSPVALRSACHLGRKIRGMVRRVSVQSPSGRDATSAIHGLYRAIRRRRAESLLRSANCAGAGVRRAFSPVLRFRPRARASVSSWRMPPKQRMLRCLPLDSPILGVHFSVRCRVAAAPRKRQSTSAQELARN